MVSNWEVVGCIIYIVYVKISVWLGGELEVVFSGKVSLFWIGWKGKSL